MYILKKNLRREHLQKRKAEAKETSLPANGNLFLTREGKKATRYTAEKMRKKAAGDIKVG
jgi:hypothetical protein